MKLKKTSTTKLVLNYLNKRAPRGALFSYFHKNPEPKFSDNGRYLPDGSNRTRDALRH